MNSRVWKALGLLMVASVILAACAPATTVPPASVPATPTSVPAVPTSALAAPTSAPSAGTSVPTAAPYAPSEVETITYLEHFSVEWGDTWFLKTIAGFEAQNPNIKVTLIEKPFPDIWRKTCLTS
jgi:ABC-type glycerol-3-phosphate transport system substrate-binding protein